MTGFLIEFGPWKGQREAVSRLQRWSISTRSTLASSQLIGEGREGVAAVDRAELGADEDLASGTAIPFQPAVQQGLGKGQPVFDLLGEVSLGVGDGHLGVVTVEGAKVELLRALDEVGPDEEAVYKVRRHQMLDYGEVGEVP